MGIVIERIAIRFYISLQFRIVSDNLIWYRKIYRDNMYSIDYSDDGGETWELDIVVLEADETSVVRTIDSSPEGYRDQVRSGIYCIDQELTQTGFAGIENTDWENIITIQPN